MLRLACNISQHAAKAAFLLHAVWHATYLTAMSASCGLCMISLSLNINQIAIVQIRVIEDSCELPLWRGSQCVS